MSDTTIWTTRNGRRYPAAVIHGPEPTTVTRKRRRRVVGLPADQEKAVPSGHLRGEQLATAKVDADDVREIRRRAALNDPFDTFRAIGADFGISGARVGQIVSRKAWAHVA